MRTHNPRILDALITAALLVAPMACSERSEETRTPDSGSVPAARSPSDKGGARAARKDTEAPAAEAKTKREPRLELALSANWGMAEIIRGTPLMLTVTLRNRSAEERVRLSRLIETYKTHGSPGEREAAKTLIPRWEAERQDIPADPVVLHLAGRAPTEWISFELKAQGKARPFSWPMTVLERPEGARVTLGHKPTYFRYGVGAKVAETIPAGDYRLRAKLSPGLCEGVSEGVASEPITLRVRDPKRAKVAAVRSSRYVAALFHLRGNDPASALKHARQLVATEGRNPTSLFILGRAEEIAGNSKAAREAYREAIQLARRADTGEPVSPTLMRAYLRVSGLRSGGK